MTTTQAGPGCLKIFRVCERPPYFIGYWANGYSTCTEDGHIMQFVRQIKSEKTLSMHYGDGLLDDGTKSTLAEPISQCPNPEFLMGVLCTRLINPSVIKNRLVLFPLDDDIFEYGLRAVLARDGANVELPWEERAPTLFWRGAATGTRNELVKALDGYPHADVRFVHTIWTDRAHRAEYARYYDPDTNGSQMRPVSLADHVRHKYLITCSGFILASNAEWIFGTGSVPLLWMNPLDDFWFRESLVPFENYVPIDYSLGNLRSALDWLREHDAEAKQIAANAAALADRIFSPEFQREYLTRELS